jgi:hypothetical protein
LSSLAASISTATMMMIAPASNRQNICTVIIFNPLRRVQVRMQPISAPGLKLRLPIKNALPITAPTPGL